MKLIDVPLDADERDFLVSGLGQWGGPTSYSAGVTTLLGFGSTAEMKRAVRHYVAEIRAGQPLAGIDWPRALVAPEIVFGSDLLGCAYAWSIVTGLSDEESIRALRKLQRKLVLVERGLVRVPGAGPPDWE